MKRLQLFVLLDDILSVMGIALTGFSLLLVAQGSYYMLALPLGVWASLMVSAIALLAMDTALYWNWEPSYLPRFNVSPLSLTEPVPQPQRVQAVLEVA